MPPDARAPLGSSRVAPARAYALAGNDDDAIPVFLERDLSHVIRAPRQEPAAVKPRASFDFFFGWASTRQIGHTSRGEKAYNAPSSISLAARKPKSTTDEQKR